MKTNRFAKVSIVTVTVALLAGAAMAQGPRGERGWGMWGNDGPGWGMGMGMFGRWGRGADWMLDRSEGRLAFMKTELAITEAQTPAWNQFAEAVRAAAKRHNERMKALFAGQEKSKTLPERVDAQEQFMSVHLEEVRLIKTSLKNLYGMLSEAQRKEADEMVVPMMGPMMGMGGPWG